MSCEKSISFSFLKALDSATEFEVLSVDCDTLFEEEATAPPLSAITVFVFDLRKIFRSLLFASAFDCGILRICLYDDCSDHVKLVVAA